MELTAVKNPRVMAAAELKQKKYREKAGMFLAEGLRSAEEALAACAVESVFYTGAESARLKACLETAEAMGVRLYKVSETVLEKIADTKTPQGIVAVCRMKFCSLDDIFRCGGMLLALDRIADPGNLGTILRNADAAGACGVVLLSGCADLYSPKAVRASMGSVFHVPAVWGVSEDELFESARKAGYTVAATCLSGAESLYNAELAEKTVLVMGSEGAGVSGSILSRAGQRLYIPMPGAAESLNVAVASGIFLFEFARRSLMCRSCGPA